MAVPAATLAVPVLSAITYHNYVDPDTTTAGETSIGVDPYTNTIMFQLIFSTDRLNFDYGTSPPTPTWAVVSPPTQITTLDPILYSDRDSGRTFVVHNLAAVHDVFITQAIPGVAKDGDLWINTVGTTAPAFDHETVGAGPHAIVPRLDSLGVPTQVAGAANAMYMCGQLGALVCARSDDDGLTFGPYTVLNVLDTCGGLSGHVIVDKIGTAYVPNKDCSPNGQGVHVSADNGVTWTTYYVPNTVAENSDPALAADQGGRVWIAMGNAGVPMVSWSDDQGQHWSNPVAVNGPYASGNVEFPMMAAGSAGRAAMAWYGTPTSGNDQSASFTGEWHLYIATTTDNGATWTTVDATPNDPVQRGCIWLQGGGNPCRNLLDFQGMTYDAQGRVVVGYADGCTSAACVAPTGVPNDSRDSRGVVALQTSGPGLLP
jgi:hypothetical protein